MKKNDYSAREVASEILKKVQYAYNDLKKANTAHEIEPGKEPSTPDADCSDSVVAGEVCKPQKGSKEGSSEIAKETKPAKKCTCPEGQCKCPKDQLEDAKEELDAPGQKVPEHEQELTPKEKEVHDATEDESDEEEVAEEHKAKSFDKVAGKDAEEAPAKKEDEDKKKPFAKKMVKSEEEKLSLKKSIDLVKSFVKKRRLKMRPYKKAMGLKPPKPGKTVAKVKTFIQKKELKKKQGVPAEADPVVHERCVHDLKEKGKSKSSAFAICNAVKAGQKK